MIGATTTRECRGVHAIADLLEAGTNQFELLEFQIEEIREGRVAVTTYGINVYKVLRVIPAPEVFQIPGQGVLVLGVFDFDGETLPLLDLRGYLGLGQAPSESERLLIVAEFNNVRVGIEVNGATRIHRLGWADVRIPSDAERRTIYRGIVGLVVFDDMFIRVLHVEEILAEAGMGSLAYIGEADLSELEASIRMLSREEEALTGYGSDGRTEGRAVVAESPVAVGPVPLRLALVVDDSGMMRNLVAKVLELEGYETLKFPDGQAAWNKIQTLVHQARVQDRSIEDMLPIGVLDVEMPLMDGFTLTRQIKADPLTSGIKVLIHSSLGGNENMAKALAVGADGFEVKFDAKRLLESIRKMVS